MKKMKKGEITAFLSLVMILLFSFIGAILESASIQVSKNYKRADMSRAIESVFAEYQKELLEEYDIFSLEGSYETGIFSEENMVGRLEYFGAGGMEHTIEKIQLLTDSGGLPFYEQVVLYMEHKAGVSQVRDFLGMTSVWEEQEEIFEEYQKEDTMNSKELEGLLEESEVTLPEAENPLENITHLKQSNLLQIVFPDSGQLSNKIIELSELPSHRSLKTGHGNFEEPENLDGALSNIFFGEYILEHFKTAAEPAETGALSYETEYLIAGRGSDQENLEAVVKRLLAIRFGPNYMYLQMDAAKRAEAEALAATLATAAALPVLTEVVAQALLFAWAYGECIMDMRALLKGQRVPLLKTAESWQLQLSGLMKLGTAEDMNEGKDTEGGMRYEEYLRILLFLERKESLIMRVIDMVEKNLQIKKGLTYFRADHCISKIKMGSLCNLRRGIQYNFSTAYGYR